MDSPYVLTAGRFDVPGADHAARVGEQDDLQKYPRLVGRGAHLVVAIPRFDLGEIDLVIEQVVQCVFEGAGKYLAGQIHREQALTVVNGLEARHRGVVLEQRR